jgi:hypothetical protein
LPCKLFLKLLDVYQGIKITIINAVSEREAEVKEAAVKARRAQIRPRNKLRRVAKCGQITL